MNDHRSAPRFAPATRRPLRATLQSSATGCWVVRDYWAPLLVWVLLTYTFSSDMFSAAETSRFIVPVLEFLFPWLSREWILALHGVVRKLGHIAEYFVMAILTYRAVRLSSRTTAAIILSGLFVLSVASLDELRQTWTLYRGGSPFDVGYDCFGGLLGIWLFVKIECRRRGSATGLSVARVAPELSLP